MTLVILLLFNSNGGQSLDGGAILAFFSQFPFYLSTIRPCYVIRPFILKVEAAILFFSKSIYTRSFVTSEVAHGGGFSTFGYFTSDPFVFYDLFFFPFYPFLPFPYYFVYQDTRAGSVVVVSFASSETKRKKNEQTHADLFYGSHIPVW